MAEQDLVLFFIAVEIPFSGGSHTIQLLVLSI